MLTKIPSNMGLLAHRKEEDLMDCPKCGVAVADGSAFCSTCGSPVASGEGKSPAEVNPEWLTGVLKRAGYEVAPAEKDQDAVLAKHAKRLNVVVTVRRGISLITVSSFWGTKKGWGQEKAMLTALNAANARSWLNTFSVDKDGDINVSAYIVMANRLSEADVVRFLERASDSFFETVKACGLMEFLK
jgi:Putative bacterial sensory transduction regulator/zinc-ribbon domain